MADSESTRVSHAGEQRSARVESLRAIAALGVLIGHVYGAAYLFSPELFQSFFDRIIFGGGFGVFLFFTLSGYLLFWPFAKRDYGGGGGVDLRRYAINRALRILPLYYAMVVVLLVFQEDGGTFGQWWRFLLFAESFSLETITAVNGVVWSLVVELHFYALLPFIAWGIAKVARGSRVKAALALVALGLPTLAIQIIEVQINGPADPRLRLSIVATFFYFVSGMLLALLRVSWEERRPDWVRGLLARGDVWLLASIPLWFVAFYRYKAVPLTTVASFLMVGAVVLPLKGGPVGRLLEWRPLVSVGVASYSLYLWHLPLVLWIVTWGWVEGNVLLTHLVCLPISIVVALLSFRYIEAPFLRLRRRWAPSTPTHVGEQPAFPAPASPAPELAPADSGR